MTIREFSVELGVSSAYMEDEIALLEKYGLIKALNGGKYQTNLLIFTEDYRNECYRMLEKECTEKVAVLLWHLKEKLSLIRKLGFIGASLDDNRMTWGLYWLLMREGHALFEKDNGNITARDTIYQGARGINYGLDHNEYAGEYGADGFAGYVKLTENYAAAFADFGILPQKNRFSGRSETVKNMPEATVNGDTVPEFMIFSKEEMCALTKLLAEEFVEMKSLYEWLSGKMTDIMKIHAPKHMGELAEHIVASTIFFRSVGFFGVCGVRSNMLVIPEDEKPIAFYVYERK